MAWRVDQPRCDDERGSVEAPAVLDSVVSLTRSPSQTTVPAEELTTSHGWNTDRQPTRRTTAKVTTTATVHMHDHLRSRQRAILILSFAGEAGLRLRVHDNQRLEPQREG
jgi:hypothetical protein